MASRRRIIQRRCRRRCPFLRRRGDRFLLFGPQSEQPAGGGWQVPLGKRRRSSKWLVPLWCSTPVTDLQMMKGVSQLKAVYKHFRKYRAQDGVGLVFIDFEGTQLPQQHPKFHLFIGSYGTEIYDGRTLAAWLCCYCYGMMTGRTRPCLAIIRPIALQLRPLALCKQRRQKWAPHRS